METLYDLLGALPRDDAEELRSAFRRAVKGAHPDLNPNDPLAGQKFREIVRANDILSDDDQRAAYDHLLDLAKKEQKKQKTVKVMHTAASSVIALVFASSLALGGYVAYQLSPEFAEAVRHVAGATLVQPGDFASLPPSTPSKAASAKALAAFAKALPPSSATEALPVVVVKTEPVIPAKPPIASVDTSVLLASAEPPAATDAIVPVAVTATAPAAEPGNSASASVGPPLEIAPGDPKVYRERGIFAYRSGDFDGAIAAFDRAIQIDPKFSAAYVDRSIVLYRMQRFERAFADIAQAKRLEKASRAAKVTVARKKAAEAAAAVGYPPFFHGRTARLEASTTP
jgi:tetratricopeptide (TPR) repeat protein